MLMPMLSPSQPSQAHVTLPLGDEDRLRKAAAYQNKRGDDGVSVASPSDTAVPPVPHIGSLWESREHFKDACVKHGAASRPRFGFATSGSNNVS